MPISEEMKKLLDGVDEKTVSEISGLYDRNEQLESINTDLVAQKKALKANKVDLTGQTEKLITDFAEQQKELEALKGVNTDTDRLKLESEGKINSLTEKLDKMFNEMEAIKLTSENDKKAVREKDLLLSKNSMFANIRKALTEKNITGESLEYAIDRITARNRAVVKEDDGVFSHSFIVEKEGKPVAMENASALAEFMATENPKWVSGSNIGGLGLNHQNETDKTIFKTDNLSPPQKADMMLARANANR